MPDCATLLRQNSCEVGPQASRAGQTRSVELDSCVTPLFIGWMLSPHARHDLYRRGRCAAHLLLQSRAQHLCVAIVSVPCIL